MDFQLSVNNGNLEHKACWYRGGFIGALRLLEMTGQTSPVLKRICDQYFARTSRKSRSKGKLDLGVDLVCYTAVFRVVRQRSSPCTNGRLWGGALHEETENGCVAD